MPSSRGDLERRDRLGGAIADALADSWRGPLRAAARPRVLYHYTTTAGLLGIVQSREIWATSARFLNDREEINYSVQVILSVLEERREREKTAELENLLFALLKTLHLFYGPMLPYVTCFCRRGDLLSQWRGYSRGSGGVSIGFSVKDLVALRGRTVPIFTLVKVLYKPPDQAAAVGSLIDHVTSACRRIVETEGPTAWEHIRRTAIRYASAELALFAGGLKHPSFAEEQEWRLVALPGGSGKGMPRFRESAGVLVPYVGLAFDGGEVDVAEKQRPLPIREVICGPSADPVWNRESIALLLKAEDIRDVDVEISSAPLRMSS